MKIFRLLFLSIVFIAMNFVYAQTSFNVSNKTTGDTLLTIDENGRVGIGTTTPGTSIDVNSSAVESASSFRLGNLDNTRFFRFYSGNATYSPMIRWHEGAALRFAAWTDTYNEFMRLTADGNLGIGTITPSTKLEVADTIFSSFGGFMFPDSTVQETASGGNVWNLTGSDIYYNSGNVGIGTASPAYPLTIFPSTNTRGLYIDHNQTSDETTYGVFVDLDRTGTGNADIYGIRSAATSNNSLWSTRGLMATADGEAEGPKYGVYATAEGAGSLYGVKGVANSTSTNSQYGIWGEAIGSGTGAHYGVYGTTSGGGSNHWAGYFNGNVYVDNNLGIGTSMPTEMLQVADTIYSSVGGFKFPDGTVQETAAGSGISGNTLDQAYDQGGAGAGRDITADNGSVRILGNDGLYVQGDINTSGSVHSGGSLFLYGSGSEGGQISLRDGDDDGGWIIDNYGNSNSESIRIFNPDGATPVFNALVINELGNVGIGTGGPSADLQVDGTDGVVFNGIYGSGTIPVEGAGERMMWYPAKAAFRAGQVASEYFWDDDSVGSHSTAFGNNTIASGDASLAIGNLARAQGDNSVALGYFNLASGNSSLAMGRITVASGSNSSAMGYTTTASGNYSTVAGFQSTASGHWSTAIGNSTEASGDNSFAIGQNSIASGQVSTATGFHTNATGGASTSLGSATTASGNISLAAGLSTIASGNYSVALGRHIEAAGEGSIAIGLQDMGDLQVTQDSTMAIMGGKVGIGTAAPTEMLEVADTIYSSIGGFKFPDQTVQTTAATGGGIGNTLDQAYDEGGAGAGRIITADSGPVHITGSDGFVVNGNIGIASTTPDYPLEIYPGTNTRGINIDHNQSGTETTRSIFVDLDKTSVSSSEISGAELQVTNNGSGVSYGLHANVNGTADGFKFGVRGDVSGEGWKYGLYGFATGTDTQFGVFGAATGGGTNWAGYFGDGNVHIANRLGLGTTTPSAGLHLHGTGFPSSFMYLSSETGGSAGFRLYEGSIAKWHIFNSYTLDGLQIYNDNGQTVFYADQTTGYVGIGTTSPTSKLDVRGNVTVRNESTGDIVIELGTGLDYAEGFDVSDKTDICPGTVLCIDENNPGNLKMSEQSYDYKVAGIVAGANALGSGVTLGSGQHDFNVALAGRVYCNVDASQEEVKAGDLLTTSNVPGFAQKVTDYQKSQGAILGKAMQNLEKGQKGQILVLVTLQ